MSELFKKKTLFSLKPKFKIIITLIEEVNKLEWVSIDDNFFDMNKYAGEGNIGHIIEEIKIDMNK